MVKKNNLNYNLNIVSSSILLIVGGLICKFLGAFYRIPLSNILGAQGIGIYQILFPLYMISYVFVGGGLTFALSMLVSKSLALKKEKNIAKYFFTSLTYAIVVGGVFFILFMLLSGTLEVTQNVVGAKFSYYLIGLSVLFSGIIACFRGLFQGYNHMTSTVASQLIEQTFKLGVGLIFASVLLKYGLYWGVFGAFLGLLASEVFAFVYYVFLSIIFFKRKKLNIFKIDFSFKKEKKELFKISFPVLISQIILPISFGTQSILIINLLLKSGAEKVLATSQYGILTGMVNSLINFPAVISVSLAVAIVPSISFLLAKKQIKSASKLIKNVYKTLWITALPCMVAFLLLAENILGFVFFNSINSSLMPTAVTLLQIASFQILFMGFVQISVVLLQLVLKTWQAIFALGSFMISNIILMIILTSSHGIFGLATANLIAYGICCFVCLIFLRNKFETKFSVKEVFLPIFSSLIIGYIIYLFKRFFENKMQKFIFLILVAFTCIAIYFGILIVFKLIKKDDFILNNKKS